MRILHVRPPKIKGALEESMVQHPVNLLYLAAAARAEGHEVHVWDFEVEKFSETIVKHKAKELKPDLIGITGMTCNIKIAAQIMAWVREVCPGVFTVAGGPHGSAIPERTLAEFPAIDAVVIGEGELTWCELAGKLQKGEPLAGTLGLAWRGQHGIVVEQRRPLIKDIDTLAFPARDLINLDLYKGASSPGLDSVLHRSTELFSTRGCPERCIFCAAKVTFGRTVRFRSAANFLAEVDECVNRYGYHHITVEDDTFTYRPNRLEEICRGLKERGLTWDCDTRVNLVTQEMLLMMKASGCRKVAFGVESGSPEIVKKLKKDISLDQVKNAFRWAKEAGLITTAFFIVGGHPDETPEDVEMSWQLMKEIDPDLMAVAIGVPFPGTELEAIMKERGLILREEWQKYTHIHSEPVWNTHHYKGPDLVKLQTRLFRRFFLRPHFVMKTLRQALSVQGVKYYARSTWQIFRYLFLEKRN